jgi:hypothetical protein
MVPTAKETKAAITGFPAVLASLELIAACIGSTAPNARAIAINKKRDCILAIKIVTPYQAVNRGSYIDKRYQKYNMRIALGFKLKTTYSLFVWLQY